MYSYKTKILYTICYFVQNTFGDGLSLLSVMFLLVGADSLESDFEFEYSKPLYPNLIQNPMCFRILHLNLNMTEDSKFK